MNLPFKFSAGKKAKADEVNANFQALLTGIEEQGTSLLANISALRSNMQSSIETVQSSVSDTLPVVEYYNNGTSGYLLFANDFCWQFGQISFTATSQQLRFLKKFRDYNYGVHLFDMGSARVPYGYSRTALEYCTVYASAVGNGATWQAIGFVA